MENWFENTLRDISKHVEQVENLRRADLEIRFQTKLNTIYGLIKETRLDEASIELNTLANTTLFRPELTPRINHQYQTVRLLIQIAHLKENALVRKNRGNHRKLLQRLQEIERQAEEHQLDLVSNEVIELRRRIYINDAHLGISPKSNILTQNNIVTFIILAILSVLTAKSIILSLIHGGLHTTEIEDWLYNLHPEMLGATVTFILLTVIFDNSRRHQDIKQLQYIYYEELISTPQPAERKKIIDRMRREDLLRGAYLAGLDWQEIDLRGANLHKAVMNGCINIDKALFDNTTILPNGKRFDPQKNITKNFAPYIVLEI